MAVGGPNQRNDFHVQPTDEWFYQYKGDMLLKIVDGEEFKDIWIREGEMMLLPGDVPHNPVRFADTVGIVIERSRPEGKMDALRWYCQNQNCRRIVHEERFRCEDLGTQLKPLIERYRAEEELRRCKECGQIDPVS